MPEVKVPALKLHHLPTPSDTDTADTDDRSDSNGSAVSSMPPPPPPPPLANGTSPAPIVSHKATAKGPNDRQKRSKKRQPGNVTSAGRYNQMRKLRASNGRLPIQKPVKVSLKQVPRALLNTPSSSSLSLVTNSSTDVSSKATTPRSSVPLPLLRQPTSAILKFQVRKSVSQMDLKHARRTGNYIPNAPRSNPMSTGGRSKIIDNKMLAPKAKNAFRLDATTSQVSMIDSLLNRHYFNTPERENRCAGMRIFATIMLNAWRKRRDEVKRLAFDVEELKRGAIKSKNQLHVFNTLFRVEQRRNDELTAQLKHSIDNCKNTKSSCESLTTSLLSVKADKELVENELMLKEREFEGLNELLSQTKSELFKSMTYQRELQSSMSMEQRKVQHLQNQKNDLINKICELNSRVQIRDEHMRNILENKNMELIKTKETMQKYEDMIQELFCKNNEMREIMDSEEKLELELQALKAEAEWLRRCLNGTLDNRIKKCLKSTMSYPRLTAALFHLAIFFVLPGMPLPTIKKIPFGLSLVKALNIIRR